MNSLYLILLAVLLLVSASTQQQFSDAKVVSASAGVGSVRNSGIYNTRDGGYVVALSFQGELLLAGTTYSSTETGAWDVLVVKYSAARDIMWTVVVPCASSQEKVSVVVSVDNSIYLNVEPGVSTLSIGDQSHTVTNQMLLVKFNSQGTCLWIKSAPQATHFAPSIGGGVLVAASFCCNVTLGSTVLKTTGGNDYFVAHYSAEGVLSWTIHEVGPGLDKLVGVDVDLVDGSFYVAGTTSGGATLRGHTIPSSTGFIVKYSRAGGLQWIEYQRGDDFHPVSLRVAKDKSIYLTGLVNQVATFTGTDSNEVTITSEHSKVFITKYSSLGIVQWATIVNDTISVASMVLSSNSIYISGLVDSDSAYVASFSTTGDFRYAGSLSSSQIEEPLLVSSSDRISVLTGGSEPMIAEKNIVADISDGKFSLVLSDFGTICFGVSSNNLSVCSGVGLCVAPDTCNCLSSGYTGDSCEVAPTNMCLGIPAYGQVQGCPQEEIELTNLEQLQVYYAGDAIVYPKYARLVHDPVDGKLGPTNRGQITNVDFGAEFSDNSFTISLWTKTNKPLVESESRSLLDLSLQSDNADRLKILLQKSGDNVNVVANYVQAGNSLNLTSFFAQDDVDQLNIWKQVTITRSADKVTISVDGDSQPVVTSGDDAILNTDLSFAAAGHILGSEDIGTLIDELSVFNTSISDVDRFDLYDTYSSNCGAWSQSFSSPKRKVSIKYEGESITIAVKFTKNSVDPVYFRLDTVPTFADTCIAAGGDIVPSIAGQEWAMSETVCSRTYTISLSLAQIYTSSNNWQIELADNGRRIVHKLKLYPVYNINKQGRCSITYAPSTVQFDTVLAASSQLSFTTTDKLAAFDITRLVINSVFELEISGELRPLLGSLTFSQVSLKKASNSVALSKSSGSDPCTDSSCSYTFKRAWTDLNVGSTAVGGSYVLTFNAEKNGETVSTGATIQFSISTNVPVDPTPVEGGTITSSISRIASDESAVSSGQISRSSATIYLKNAVSNVNLVPSGTKFSYDSGYFCCVAYPASIPSYNSATDTGGCKTPDSSLVERVELTSSMVSPSSLLDGGKGAYKISFNLRDVITSSPTPLASPLTCGVLLYSKFESSTSRRVHLLVNTFAVSTSNKIPSTQILEIQDAAVTNAGISVTASSVLFSLVIAIIASLW